MFLSLQIIILTAGLLVEPVPALPTMAGTPSARIYDNRENSFVRLPFSNNLPIKRNARRRRRGTLSGETGLGDNVDL